jgi:hypothetical protein
MALLGDVQMIGQFIAVLVVAIVGILDSCGVFKLEIFHAQ